MEAVDKLLIASHQILYAVGLTTVKPRSSKWPAVMREHLKIEPRCRACSSTKNLNVHHRIPYHIRPDLELEQSNLRTLCRGSGVDCHLAFGHSGSWSWWNLHVDEDAERYAARRKESESLASQTRR